MIRRSLQSVKLLGNTAQLSSLFCILLLSADGCVDAATYSSLTIPQGGVVQIGSPSENLFLAMQGEGNLVLYQNGTAIWFSGTAGQSCGSNQCFAAFQSDGNFVIYNGPNPIWETETNNNSGATLVLSDQLPHIEVIGTNQSILWANSFTFNAGNFRLPENASVNLGSAILFMQGDGNLVMYQGQTSAGSVLWNSGSPGHNCGSNQCFAAFQGDGNLVIYDGSAAMWSSGTNGNPAARLILSPQQPYLTITGTLVPRYAAKDYVYLGGRVIAVENP